MNLKIFIYLLWFLTEQRETGFLNCFTMARTYSSDPYPLMILVVVCLKSHCYHVYVSFSCAVRDQLWYIN